MAMTYSDALNIVLEKIKLNESEHKAFLQNVENISNEIYLTLSENNFILKEMFEQLKTTATYWKNFEKFDMTHAYEVELPFALPFDVELEFSPSIKTKCRVRADAEHPIILDGFVNYSLFEELLDKTLKEIIPKLKGIQGCNGRLYDLNYRSEEFKKNANMRIIIEAIEQVAADSVQPEYIIFTFFPVLLIPATCLPAEYQEEDENANYVTLTPGKYPSSASLNDENKENIFTKPHWHLESVLKKSLIRDVLRLLVALLMPAKVKSLGATLIFVHLKFNQLRNAINNLTTCTLENFFTDSLRVLPNFPYAMEDGRYTSDFLKIIERIESTRRKLFTYQLLDAVLLNEMLELFGLS